MLHLDPVRMRFGLRFGAPKLTPTNERTNVLTERIPTSSYRDAVLNARARTGRRVGRGLVSGCFHKRLEADRPTLDRIAAGVFAVVHDIAAECLPTNERNAR